MSVHIILLLMIRNESKIIKRCLEHAHNICDAIFILDTGSDDNTIEVATETCQTIGKPFSIKQKPWKNFGYNRSCSMYLCQQFCNSLGWNPSSTYALALDADMNLVVKDTFDKNKLTRIAYTLTQHSHSIDWKNVRFMRLSEPWKCIGSTHEYWTCNKDSQLYGSCEMDTIYIDDKGDGGCKSDKYERDLRLLTEEHSEGKNVIRCTFYIAQTYKCMGEYEKAIEWYKKRIALGGFYGEVEQAMCEIVVCSLKLSPPNVKQAEEYAMLGAVIHHRLEPFCCLIEHFRTNSDHENAYKYYKIAKGLVRVPKYYGLFKEYDKYEYKLDYEYTIFGFYLHDKKDKAYKKSIQHLKKYDTHFENVLSNLRYYPQTRFQGQITELDLPFDDEYVPSSPSMVQFNDKRIMNVRYVNYEHTEDGKYISKSPDGVIRTINKYMVYDGQRELQVMKEPIRPITEHMVKGFEDLRLFVHNNQLMFTSTCTDIITEGLPIVYGKYNIDTCQLEDYTIVKFPTQHKCEKNWIHLPIDSEYPKFIYSWYPFTIGTLIGDELVLDPPLTSSNQYSILSHCRGSSNLVEYKDGWIGLVHLVVYGTPRTYYHMFVHLTKDFVPKSFTAPFYFQKPFIEYSLCMYKENGNICVVFSRNDSFPALATISEDNIQLIDL